MVRYYLQLVVTRDYFYCLQYHRRPVNDLSTAVQLTNRLLRFWADGGLVYYKRVSNPQIITSWFAIALNEIRTRRILRDKADCKQSKLSEMSLTYIKNNKGLEMDPWGTPQVRMKLFDLTDL